MQFYNHFYLWNDYCVVLIWSMNSLMSSDVHIGQVSEHTNSRWAIESSLLIYITPFMMTSLNGNSLRVTGPLCGEFTGHRWIPLTKASDRELWCFLWSAPWINGWVNNGEAGDLRRHRAHYDVFVMSSDSGMLLIDRITAMWWTKQI